VPARCEAWLIRDPDAAWTAIDPHHRGGAGGRLSVSRDHRPIAFELLLVGVTMNITARVAPPR
jgi:hypothetical protein